MTTPANDSAPSRPSPETSEEKHICGASGFGLGVGDSCPACDAMGERLDSNRVSASAPASPSEGETRGEPWPPPAVELPVIGTLRTGRNQSSPAAGGEASVRDTAEVRYRIAHDPEIGNAYAVGWQDGQRVAADRLAALERKEADSEAEARRLMANIKGLRTRVEQAEAALKTYGVHYRGCPKRNGYPGNPPVCICGFDAARTTLRAPSGDEGTTTEGR